MTINTEKARGIKAGTICFSVFMLPWLGCILWSLIPDPTGFNGESIAGILIGIVVFAAVSAFLGFSIAKKSVILIVLASLCIVALPIWWVMMPWLP
jgi:hypothetical protein